MEIRHRLSDVLPARAVRALSARSDAAGAARLAPHLALWLAAMALTWRTIGGPWLLPAMALQGVVQVALFAGLHECVHRTAFRSRRPNDLAAAAIGFVLGLPAGYFRRFHFAHHRFTQDPARDPELAGPKPETVLRYLRYAAGWAYWRDRTRELLRHARGRQVAGFVPPAERAAVVREARWHLALYLAVAASSLATGRAEAVWLWLGPALLGQPWLRLYLLAEHTGAALDDDMLANTRTTYTSAPVRFLMWNMPYHCEHHMYPAVPFHRLPELNRLLAPHLKVSAPGYGTVHRAYWRALRRGAGAVFTRAAPAPSSPRPS